MEKSVNQFIKEMAESWADTDKVWNFRATNGEHTYRGTIEDGKVSTIKVQSVAESQRKIREMLGHDKR